MHIYSSSNASIENAGIFRNYNGMYLHDSMECRIKNASIMENTFGIYGDGMISCIIEGNGICHNNYGIYLHSSFSNIIYNNYFNNTINVHDDGINAWNISKIAGINIIGGAWLGGNYWHDYDGIDLDGDGLGDTMLPYNNGIINGGDWLPLLPDLPPRITNISFPAKVHNFINISCEVFDPALEGVYINITLPDGGHINSTMEYSNGIFYYNLSSTLYGAYSFYIYAIDMAGNGRRSGEMGFDIYPPWDINMDDAINVLDLILIGQHFNAVKGEELYERDIDANRDGIINVLDMIVVASHWR